MPQLKYTDHAVERMFERGISKSQIQSALKSYDDSMLEADGDTKFIKNIQRGSRKRRLHVVAMPLPHEGKDTWLIKTVWVRGEDDPNFIVKFLRRLWMRLVYRKS